MLTRLAPVLKYRTRESKHVFQHSIPVVCCANIQYQSVPFLAKQEVKGGGQGGGLGTSFNGLTLYNTLHNVVNELLISIL